MTFLMDLASGENSHWRFKAQSNVILIILYIFLIFFLFAIFRFSEHLFDAFLSLSIVINKTKRNKIRTEIHRNVSKITKKKKKIQKAKQKSYGLRVTP